MLSMGDLNRLQQAWDKMDKDSKHCQQNIWKDTVKDQFHASFDEA